MSDEHELLERIAALEWALESPEWRRLTTEADQEFTREGLRHITELARVMYLKNPIIQRGVTVKQLYVWGQGWTVQAADERIQEALDAFLYDRKNDTVIGSHSARMQMEVELATDGNVFFCLFVSQLTGQVRVRRIAFDEILDVICDPEDAQTPWYYRRQWTAETFDPGTGSTRSEQRTAYYPDWRYSPTNRPATIGGHPVYWNSPVYHVKVGGFASWKFGLSEVYDSIDWASAYKNFLEDWASIVRAYRRFAFQLSTPGGSRGVAAARAKLNTTLGQGGTGRETNPPAVTGSTFIASEGTSLQPVRTSGATVSAEDGRRLLLMAAASFGLPETFFGDAQVGTLATAKSLDRPTELMMEDRQQLWRDVFLNLFEFVLRWAVKAPRGALHGLGSVTTIVEDGEVEERLEWNSGVNDSLSIDFPPLLQHDVGALVDATVKAATLGQVGTLAGTIDLVTLSRILLTQLGVDNVQEIVDQLFPGGEIPEPEEPEPDDTGGESDDEIPERPQAEALMIDAVRDLRAALVRLQEGAA